MLKPGTYRLREDVQNPKPNSSIRLVEERMR